MFRPKENMRCFMVLFALLSFSCLYAPASASWLIDEQKFHASVHGQITCQNCHEAVQGQELHPDPGDIIKQGTNFFRIDVCLACHDDILGRLKQGLHGSKQVKEPETYKDCLSCHDPHGQVPVKGKEGGRFDPSKPRHEQCGVCHKEKTTLPSLSADDEACMVCHRFIASSDPKSGEKIATNCFHCHGQGDTKAQQLTSARVSPINRSQYSSSPHAGVNCTVCHPQAAGFDHQKQKSADCRQCHLPHDEKVAHDAHAGVRCESCHLKDVQPVRDAQSGLVLWKRDRKSGESSRIHEMVARDDQKGCRRCHVKGNQVGAVAMILPPKGVLCMPCHAATFSLSDTTTIMALVVFLAGMVMMLSYVLSGAIPGTPNSGSLTQCLKLLWLVLTTLISSRVLLLIKTLILDVLLQRRLYRQSVRRWFIHSLIFWPLVIRFFWGLVALLGSLWRPQWSWIWDMLDKNHPVSAFLFDVTGMMIVLGIFLAFVRGARRRTVELPALPRQDRFALALIAGIVVMGFLLEGMRMAMTGYPGGSAYAVLGYGISQLFSNPSALTGVYGYIWYLHAMLTGVFIAYVPFSRLLHMIVAPVVLVMGAEERDKGTK